MMGDIPESQRINSLEALREWMRHEMIRRSNWGSSTTVAQLTPRTLINATNHNRDRLFDFVLERGINEGFWTIRECFRMTYKEYAQVKYPLNTRDEERLNQYLNGDFEKFVHLSKDEPLYIAYTPDENYGKADRRVKTTVGRFLKKFHPSLTDADIRKLVDIHRYYYGVDDVKFATSAADIERVYCSLGSCMGYPWSDNSEHYGSQVHPSLVYETPDFKLAYMEREGRINSRCVTWTNPENPEDKRWIRAYGDEVLIRKLEAMGYKHSNLNGAKLKKIPAVARDGRELPNTYVCPYIDDSVTGDRDAQIIELHDDHLYITTPRASRNSTNVLGRANRTSGLVGLNSEYVRAYNDRYGVRHMDGRRDLSPEEERNAKTCHCCGTKHNSGSGVIWRAPNLEEAGGPEVWVCQDCVGEGKDFVRAYDSRGNLIITRRENAVGIRNTSDWVVKDTVTFAAVDVRKLSVKYYGEDAYAWGSSVSTLGDEVIMTGDTFYDYWEDQRYHVSQRIRTQRGVVLSKGMETLKEGLFYDAENGWVRSVSKSKSDVRFEPLRDWLIGLAAVNSPRKRLGALKKALHGEDNPDLVTLLLEVQKKILAEEGREKLINEAAQAELPGVAEVA